MTTTIIGFRFNFKRFRPHDKYDFPKGQYGWYRKLGNLRYSRGILFVNNQIHPFPLHDNHPIAKTTNFNNNYATNANNAFRKPLYRTRFLIGYQTTSQYLHRYNNIYEFHTDNSQNSE